LLTVRANTFTPAKAPSAGEAGKGGEAEGEANTEHELPLRFGKEAVGDAESL
jgi:hypothetical protein